MNTKNKSTYKLLMIDRIKKLQFTNTQIAESLIDNGAQLELNDGDDNTPLHLACRYDEPTIEDVTIILLTLHFTNNYNPLHLYFQI